MTSDELIDFCKSRLVERPFVLDTSEKDKVYALSIKDERFVRISEQVYCILKGVAEGLSYEAIAFKLSHSNLPPTPEEVKKACEKIVAKISTIEASPKSNTHKSLWLKTPFLGPSAVGFISKLFAPLFHPLLFSIFLLATALAFVYAGKALTSIQFADTNLLGGYLLFLLSILGHELGHSSACKWYGAKPKAIGIGLYLIYPSFYSDVSDAWRLKRWQRVMVDLGGMYFQLIFAAIYVLLFQLTQFSSFQAALVLIWGSLAFSLNPVFKFDGYWILADALGVVNLSQQPRRIVRHFVRLNRKRLVDPLPWNNLTIVLLCLYSVITILFWLVFIVRVLPFLLQQLWSTPQLIMQISSIFVGSASLSSLRVFLPNIVILFTLLMLLGRILYTTALRFRKRSTLA